MEEVTGQPLSEYLAQNVFVPAKLATQQARLQFQQAIGGKSYEFAIFSLTGLWCASLRLRVEDSR
jgi:hypothetical protein